MNNELLKQELIEKESLLNTISNHRYKTDFCYLGSDLARANVLDEALNYTFLHSKETLEAYNRECKRVDELTIERDHWLETAKSNGTKIRELEGLLKHAVEWIEENHSETHDTRIYKKALNL